MRIVSAIVARIRIVGWTRPGNRTGLPRLNRSSAQRLNGKILLSAATIENSRATQFLIEGYAGPAHCCARRPLADICASRQRSRTIRPVNGSLANCGAFVPW
jgi:hypothetical protein